MSIQPRRTSRRNLDTQFADSFEPATPDVVLENVDEVNPKNTKGYTKVRTPTEAEVIRQKQRKFRSERSLAEEDEDEAVTEEFLRGGDKNFSRTDNRQLHYFQGLVADLGFYPSVLLRHLVMAMRHKIKQYGWRNAVEWDPAQKFAEHLGLSLRQTWRVIGQVKKAGFVLTKRTPRGIEFRLTDRTLLARTDGRHISKSLMRFLSLTEANLYTISFFHTRGLPEDPENYPPGKGYATSFRYVTRFLPWTDHDGIRMAFSRLVKKGLLERSQEGCLPFNFRWSVPERFLKLTAEELAQVFKPIR